MCDVSRGRVLSGWLDTVCSVRRGTIQQRVGVVELQQLQCRQRERECRGVEIVCGVCGGSVVKQQRRRGAVCDVRRGHEFIVGVGVVHAVCRRSVQQRQWVGSVCDVCGGAVQCGGVGDVLAV